MASDRNQSFRHLLRRLRSAADLTQEELAERAGISTRAVSDLERGVKQHPRKDTVQMLADALGLNGDERASFTSAARRPVTKVLQGTSASPVGGRSSLPAQVTPLIGRDRDAADAVETLRRQDVRLVTFTGPGGVGKTRLALEVAGKLLDAFDGVVHVPLAAITDPGLVIASIAEALGVREEGGRPLLRSIVDFLQERSLLLLLDNFEHVSIASSDVAEILTTCPRLNLLVTSRIPLRIRAEHEFAVQPLGLPGASHSRQTEDASHYPAVALFIERARAVQPHVAVNADNVRAIADICRRLDGLPLAIELAAARTKLLPPPMLLNRLERGLDLLTAGGIRDLPPRQQTMHATINWSYELLDNNARMLFRRLSVFRGGFSLDAVESVCNGDGTPAFDAIDGLSSLVDASLVRPQGASDEPRFAMLETVREFALELLKEAGVLEATRAAHASHFRLFADRAEAALGGTEQQAGLDQFEVEHDNLRAALQWLLETDKTEEATGLAASLWWFWWVRGHLSEGRRWLEQALASDDRSPSKARARALVGAGTIAESQGEYSVAIARHQEALELSRLLQDDQGIVSALESLGDITLDQGDLGRAHDLFEEALNLSRAMGDQTGVAHAFLHLGAVAYSEGNGSRAASMFSDALELLRALGHTRGIAAALTNLGALATTEEEYERGARLLAEAQIHWEALRDRQGSALVQSHLGEILLHQGELHKARETLWQALQIVEDLGDMRTIASVQDGLATALCRLGDTEPARLHLASAITIFGELGDKDGLAASLDSVAELAVRLGDLRPAAVLFGAAEGIRAGGGFSLPAVYQRQVDGLLDSIRAGLHADQFDSGVEFGRRLTWEEAVSTALAYLD